MTLKELSGFDGKEERRAYVAYKGVVYDVTESPLWKKGKHAGKFQAGADLTPFLEQAPHGEEVFDRVPEVGTLEEKKASFWSKEGLKRLYARFHPHPMTVHFPIALHYFAGGMDLLFLLSPDRAYEMAVFSSFFAATVMGAVAMVPGMLSWWLNYDLARSSLFVGKLAGATVTLLLGVVGVAMHMEIPELAWSSGWEGWAYHGIVFATVAVVTLVAWLGGRITWPSGR